MKFGRLAIMKEGERGRGADSSEKKREVAVSVAVHVRLGGEVMWCDQGAVRVG